MRDVWIATFGFVFGWLMSKTWQDPACRTGLALFVVLAAILVLVFALAVVGHRAPIDDPEDERDGD